MNFMNSFCVCLFYVFCLFFTYVLCVFYLFSWIYLYFPMSRISFFSDHMSVIEMGAYVSIFIFLIDIFSFIQLVIVRCLFRVF